MKSIASNAVVAVISIVALSGCVDDSYDLGNLDTTARFTAKDLTLPVNLDNVKLSTIINPGDDSKIKEMDGEYVFVSDGSFESDEINIPAIKIAAPQIASTTNVIKLSGLGTNAVRGTRGIDLPACITYPLPGCDAQFSTRAYGVSDMIVDIDKVDVDFTITMKLTIQGITDVVSRYKYKNLKIQLPAGVKCIPSIGTFDEATAVVSIDEYTATTNTVPLKFVLSEIDMAKSKAEFSADAHTFSYADAIKVESGNISIETADIKTGTAIPGAITFTTDYETTDIDITKFSGTVSYKPEGLSPAPFSLGYIPDLLSQAGTNISIANPQIYLNITNPLYKYGLSADIAFTLGAKRDGQATQYYSLDKGTFQIEANKQNASYCLATNKPLLATYQSVSTHWVGFTSLSYVLSGNGLPSEIEINADDSRVPEQKVTGIALGENLGRFAGNYMFYAPLGLKKGSQIVYAKTENGWNDETVEKITIEKMEIMASVNTDCPVSIKFTGFPIDVNGNRINGVSIDGANVDANAKDQQIVITLSGKIEHLDGITFVATATSDDESTLTPDMNIDLKNIKVRVSGNYTTEL